MNHTVLTIKNFYINITSCPVVLQAPEKLLLSWYPFWLVSTRLDLLRFHLRSSKHLQAVGTRLSASSFLSLSFWLPLENWRRKSTTKRVKYVNFFGPGRDDIGQSHAYVILDSSHTGLTYVHVWCTEVPISARRFVTCREDATSLSPPQVTDSSTN